MPVQTEVTVDGTLNNDGTLELHQKPGLSPGPVKVTLVPAAATGATRGSIADTMAGIKARQQRRGYGGMNQEELDRLQQERQADDDAYDEQRDAQ